MRLKPLEAAQIIPEMFILGLWLGYPQCCALSFRVNHDGRTYTGGQPLRSDPDNPVFPLEGTGFVPCPQCVATKTADQLREEIAANRLCKTPFPLEPTEGMPAITAQLVHEVMLFRKLLID